MVYLAHSQEPRGLVAFLWRIENGGMNLADFSREMMIPTCRFVVENPNCVRIKPVLAVPTTKPDIWAPRGDDSKW
jgi:hypothetical protein